MMQEDNRMFTEMRKAAWQRLQGCNPQEIGRRAQVAFEPQRQMFCLESLGQPVQVAYPAFAVEGARNPWHELLILHYLEMADGTPLSGRTISFGELPQGMVRGGGFDRDSANILEMILRERNPREMKVICENLGAESIKGRADVSAVFWFFPRYPITLNFWFGDEEFPGSGRLLLDSSAEHYLSVEDAVTAGTVLLDCLREEKYLVSAARAPHFT